MSSSSSDSKHTYLSITKDNDAALRELSDIIGFLSASLLLAWCFIASATNAFRPSLDYGSDGLGIIHLVFIGGVAAALALVYVLTRVLEDRLKILSVLSLVVLVASFLVQGCQYGEVDADLPWEVSLLQGISFGLAYCNYGIYMHRYSLAGLERMICLTFIVSGALVGFLGVVDSRYQAWVYAAFQVLSILLMMMSLWLVKHRKKPAVSCADSDARTCVSWRSYIATAATGMSVGFSLCIMSSGMYTEAIDSALATSIVAVLVILVMLLVFVDLFVGRKLGEKFTKVAFLPFSAIVAFVIMLAPPLIRFAAAILLFCGSLIPLFNTIAAMCRHIKISDLKVSRAFARGRFFSVFGALFGMVLGFAGTSDIAHAYLGEGSLYGAVAVFVLVMILVTAFAMKEDEYPYDIDHYDEDLSPAIEEKMEAQQPVYVEPTAQGEQQHLRPSDFCICCQVIAEQHGLSERQAEVFAILARGRNAAYLAEKMVISPHTAKAHIYNIYQKLEVHSRQELIDLVGTVNPDAVDEGVLDRALSLRERLEVIVVDTDRSKQ